MKTPIDASGALWVVPYDATNTGALRIPEPTIEPFASWSPGRWADVKMPGLGLRFVERYGRAVVRVEPETGGAP